MRVHGFNEVIGYGKKRRKMCGIEVLTKLFIFRAVSNAYSVLNINFEIFLLIHLRMGALWMVQEEW